MSNEDTSTVAAVQSSLAMSDADFMNLPMPSVESTDDNNGVSTEVTTDDVSKEVTDSKEDANPTKEEVTDAASKEQKDTKEEADKEVATKDKVDTAEIDYKSEYDRLLAPFKANGKEIKIDSVDDAITLMQMGSNYAKKMEALKPSLKILKLLENNGLLSDDKISYLIDLDKKNPDAINKLIKDSGINPLDLDAEKADKYTQSTYTVDEREMALDTILDDLQSSPTYNRTLDVVTNKFDSDSKKVIAGQPQILKVIDNHMQRGIYDLIVIEMEKEQMLGRLEGLSSIEAYRKIGDSIQARGGFNHLNQGSSQVQGQPTSQPVVVVPKPAKVVDDKLNDKRRAASSTKPVAPSTKAATFNPLAMSDEEFNKQINTKFF